MGRPDRGGPLYIQPSARSKPTCPAMPGPTRGDLVAESTGLRVEYAIRDSYNGGA